MDVKPWDDETDMKQMEDAVRKISTDGLLWGAAKLVPLAYGIHKLQISCVVEDDKVSIDWLTEEIEKIEDFVSSKHGLYLILLNGLNFGICHYNIYYVGRVSLTIACQTFIFNKKIVLLNNPKLIIVSTPKLHPPVMVMA